MLCLAYSVDHMKGVSNIKSYDAFLKSQYSTIKHSSYFNVYDNLFSKYVNRQVTFVEIGVLNGGSLFMWRNFFGPQARIIGVDLNPEATIWREHGFEIFIGDQSDSTFWENFIIETGKVDIILDDGGHTYFQQVVTVSSLIEHVNDDGLIVIEDTHSSYMPQFSPKGITFIDYAFDLVHGVNKRSGYCSGQYEKKIYSVTFFEAIVAFKINREMSSSRSVTVINNNNLLNNSAFDYRFGSKHHSLYNNRFLNLIKKNAFIKKILSAFMSFILRQYLRIENNKVKKFLKYKKH